MSKKTIGHIIGKPLVKKVPAKKPVQPKRAATAKRIPTKQAAPRSTSVVTRAITHKHKAHLVIRNGDSTLCSRSVRGEGLQSTVPSAGVAGGRICNNCRTKYRRSTSTQRNNWGLPASIAVRNGIIEPWRT